MALNLKKKKYGQLLVVDRAANDKHKKAQWLCLCDCGRNIIVRAQDLKSGNTVRCNICSKERKYGTKIHNHPYYKRIYKIWHGMVARCTNTSNESYKWYGRKGIKVCKEWLDFKEFFLWAVENGYKSTYSIDRIESDKNYCPENCRWVKHKFNCSEARKSKSLKDLDSMSPEEAALHFEEKAKQPRDPNQKFFCAKPNYCVLESTGKDNVCYLFRSYKQIANFLEISSSALYYRFKKYDGKISEKWQIRKLDKFMFSFMKDQGIEVIR